MRGNNSRKLINRELLVTLYTQYDMGHGVPLSKLIRNYTLDISSPHLRKLLFIYIDILDNTLDTMYRQQLSNAIFPEWTKQHFGVIEQPDNWTYKGKFPFGEWKMVQLDCWKMEPKDE